MWILGIYSCCGLSSNIGFRCNKSEHFLGCDGASLALASATDKQLQANIQYHAEVREAQEYLPSANTTPYIAVDYNSGDSIKAIFNPSVETVAVFSVVRSVRKCLTVKSLICPGSQITCCLSSGHITHESCAQCHKVSKGGSRAASTDIVGDCSAGHSLQQLMHIFVGVDHIFLSLSSIVTIVFTYACSLIACSVDLIIASVTSFEGMFGQQLN